MVLIRLAPLLCIACSQSLFSNTDPTNDGGNGGEIPVQGTCTAPCVGDAGADFDGTPGGANMRWRYLEDLRNRTWTPMTPDAGGMVGADTNNRIAVCTASSTEHACQALPGALLVSASGATADPAIELTVPTNQHVQVSLKVHVPVGAPEQTVRLYRGSREDVLFTGTALPGMTLETAITIDALAAERVLFALSPAAAIQNVGVQLFVSGTGMAFPQACQLAMSFSAVAGNDVDNLCGGDFTHEDYNTGVMPPALGTGPYSEHGMAADLVENKFYKGTNLINRSADTTLQFWVRNDGLVPTGGGSSFYTAWGYSDLDLDDVEPGGLGVGIYDNSGIKLGVTTCTSGNPLVFAGDETPYPTDGMWHFVRVVQKAGTVHVCLDGARKFMFAAPAGSLASKYRPHLGRNVIWTPSGAFFDGGIDDVRVFTGALPCE